MSSFEYGICIWFLSSWRNPGIRIQSRVYPPNEQTDYYVKFLTSKMYFSVFTKTLFSKKEASDWDYLR